MSPQARREAVGILMAERQMGVTRACGLVGISRSLLAYQSRRQVPEGLPELIELALRQILDNAVKYSPQGSPLIVEAKRDEGGVIVSVTDRGPGIPEWEQSRIFERFYRGIEIPSPTTGSGMGLAIAREIVQAHGGEIWVDSKLGEGSRFSISLPSKPEPDI